MLVADAVKNLEGAGYRTEQRSDPNRLIVKNSPPEIGGASSWMLIGTKGDVSDKKVAWYLNRKPMVTA